MTLAEAKARANKTNHCHLLSSKYFYSTGHWFVKSIFCTKVLSVIEFLAFKPWGLVVYSIFTPKMNKDVQNVCFSNIYHLNAIAY